MAGAMGLREAVSEPGLKKLAAATLHATSTAILGMALLPTPTASGRDEVSSEFWGAA